MFDLRLLFDRAVHSAEDRRYEAALIGALDGSSVNVPGRTGYVYARRGPNGELGEIIAKNTAVSAAYGLAVKMRLEAGQWVIHSVEGQFSDPTLDPGESGVYPHASTHQHGGSDEVATATPGANAIPKAGGTGLLANGWLDATLQSIAALGTAADKYLYTTDVDTWAEGAITAFARTLLDDAAASDARTTLGLVIGTNVQAYDAELAALAGVVSAADRLFYFTGSGTGALATFTSAARDLLDDANAAAMRTTLGAVGLTGDETVAGNKTFEANTIFQTTTAMSYPVILVNRNVTATTTPLGTFGLRATTTGEMANTFGPRFIFEANDATLTTQNLVGAIAVQRNGADNSFDMSFQTASGGTLADKVWITTDGKLTVGLSSVGASVLGIKAGTSSNDAAVGGVLYVTTTQTGNVGTGEDDLASYSVPANTLAANGQSLCFEAWGTLAANVNNKTVRVRFGTSGTNLVYDSGAFGGGSITWYVRGRIWRTGAATQKGMSYGNLSNPYSSTSLNQTLSGAVTLKVTGEATSNNDIVLEGFDVWWDDNNT